MPGSQEQLVLTDDVTKPVTKHVSKAEDKLSKAAAELPYFEGDFWPNVLEESIKELDQEEEEKRRRAELVKQHLIFSQCKRRVKLGLMERRKVKRRKKSRTNLKQINVKIVNSQTLLRQAMIYQLESLLQWKNIKK